MIEAIQALKELRDKILYLQGLNQGNISSEYVLRLIDMYIKENEDKIQSGFSMMSKEEIKEIQRFYDDS